MFVQENYKKSYNLLYVYELKEKISKLWSLLTTKLLILNYIKIFGIHN